MPKAEAGQKSKFGFVRRAAIVAAEVAAASQLVGLTVLGALSGKILGVMLQNALGLRVVFEAGSLIGAALGFMVGSIVLGLIFSLAAIERNTRETALLLSRIEKK